MPASEGNAAAPGGCPDYPLRGMGGVPGEPLRVIRLIIIPDTAVRENKAGTVIIQ